VGDKEHTEDSLNDGTYRTPTNQIKSMWMLMSPHTHTTDLIGGKSEMDCKHDKEPPDSAHTLEGTCSLDVCVYV
jgi:hypothetical protein